MKTKNKLNESTPKLGRPVIPISLPETKRFSIESIYNQVQKRKDEKQRLTRVAVGLKIQKLLKLGEIKLVDKKMNSLNRGQPVRFFQKVK